MLTENDQQQAEVILPLNCLKESFTVYVADNIDRKEETLSGTRSEGGIQKFQKNRGEGCKTCRLAKYTYICKKHHCVWKKEVQPWMHPSRFLS